MSAHMHSNNRSESLGKMSKRVEPTLILDPVHGAIEVSEDELRIIDTPEFQALHHVRQLGVAWKVFPGAKHTRWEHSLGTMHIVGQFLEQLLKNQPELIQQYNIDKRVVELVRCAAQVHDLGHVCFSHLFDKHVASRLGIPEHEHRSIELFRHMVSKYQLRYKPKEVDFICGLIVGDPEEGRTRLYPRFLYDIVHNRRSDFDLERCDYLLRDALFALGTKLDLQTGCIFRHARVIGDQICYHEKVADYLKEVLEQRCKMHHLVYQRPAVVGIDAMVGELLCLLADILDWQKLFKSPTHAWRLQLTDDVIHQVPALYQQQSNYDEPKRDKIGKAWNLYQRLQTRDLYKFIDRKDEDSKSSGGSAANSNGILSVSVSVGFTSSDKNPFDRILVYNDAGKTKPLGTCHFPKVDLSVPKESSVFRFQK